MWTITLTTASLRITCRTPDTEDPRAMPNFTRRYSQPPTSAVQWQKALLWALPPNRRYAALYVVPPRQAVRQSEQHISCSSCSQTQTQMLAHAFSVSSPENPHSSPSTSIPLLRVVLCHNIRCTTSQLLSPEYLANYAVS
jgi:hypothetical protein